MIRKIEKLLNMDDYDLEAVFTPTMVNLLILDFVFSCTILPDAEKTRWWHAALTIVVSLASAVVLTRFTMHLFRAIARFIENLLYRKDHLRFPTTSMLLLGDKSTGTSQIMKRRVRDDLKTLYHISLPSKTKEEADEMEARRTAKDAVALVRKTVADSHDAMTRRMLKRYGMFRNFLGGALFCLPLSIACWTVDFSRTGTSDPIILTTLVFYLLIIVVDFFITKSAAVEYAESLLTTFNKINHNEE